MVLQDKFYCVAFQSLHILPPDNKAGIVCNDPLRIIKPDVNTIERATDANGKCVVENFTIEHRDYGTAMFPGLTDITKLDINDIGKKCHVPTVVFAAKHLKHLTHVKPNRENILSILL